MHTHLQAAAAAAATTITGLNISSITGFLSGVVIIEVMGLAITALFHGHRGNMPRVVLLLAVLAVGSMIVAMATSNLINAFGTFVLNLAFSIH